MSSAGKALTSFPWSAVVARDNNETDSKEVPRIEKKETGVEKQNSPVLLGKKKDLRHCNRQLVPTARALQHNLCVNKRELWELFEGVTFATNKGLGETAICRRRYSGSNELYALKCYHPPDDLKISSIAKVKHSNIVELLQIFSDAHGLHLVYQDTEFVVSLEQIMQLAINPWSVTKKEKRPQIGAIVQQMLGALDYLHHTQRVAHGDVTEANILLKRGGQASLANVHRGILEDRRRRNDDVRSLAKLFLRLCFPTTNVPEKSLLGAEERDMHSTLENGATRQAMNHDYLKQADAGSLASLIAYTLSNSYCSATVFSKSEWLAKVKGKAAELHSDAELVNDGETQSS